MAIQFNCERCRNPIEVDDQYADQMATCPYCSTVVRVPDESQLSGPPPVLAQQAGRPVLAEAEAGEAVEPGSVPEWQRLARPDADPRRGKALRWAIAALVFGLLGVGSIAAVSIWGMGIYLEKIDELGYDPQTMTPEETQEVAELVEQATSSNTTAALAAIGGMACGVIGLVAAIVSLVQTRTVLGVVVLSVNLLFVGCFCALTGLSLAAQGVAGAG